MALTPTDEIDPIYDGKLDFDSLMDDPILKPIAEMNELFLNNELMVNKALWEYEEKNKIVNQMLKDVPKYKETNFVNLVDNMLREMKTIIFAQDRQKDAMKKSMQEMVKICKSHYKPIVKNVYEGEGASKNEEATDLPIGKKGVLPETKPPEPEEKTFESSLVEKDIPKPKEKKEKKKEEDEFIQLE